MQYKIGVVALAAVGFAIAANGQTPPAPPAATSSSAAPLSGAELTGARVFAAKCRACHTADGSTGGVGPDLRGVMTRMTAEQVGELLSHPHGGRIAQPVRSPEERAAVIAYLNTRRDPN